MFFRRWEIGNKFKDSRVQKFKGSKIQRFKNSRVQKFKGLVHDKNRASASTIGALRL
jgi:hypothetical protein